MFFLDDDYSKLLKDLKNENYDIVIDLHKNLRSTYIKNQIKAQSYTFQKSNLAKWMKVNFKIDILPKMHLVDRYFNMLSKLGVRYDEEGLDYFYAPSTSLPNKLETNNSYIALSIGGSYSTKRLPNNRIVEICDLLKDKNIAILGGSQDEKNAQNIIAQSKNKSIISYCGKVDFDTTAKIIQHAERVITHDTATLHVAAAYNKPTISIWGNTIPEFGMYPFDNKNEKKSLILENKTLKCRPCSKIGHKKCPKKHFKCMTGIDLTKIQNYI